MTPFDRTPFALNLAIPEPGYRYMEARGDIPGAVWGEVGDTNSMSAFPSADGTMRPPRELRPLRKAAGIVPHRRRTYRPWRAGRAPGRQPSGLTAGLRGRRLRGLGGAEAGTASP